MSTLADLVVLLGLDAREYEQGLDQTASESKGWGDKISGALGGALKIGLGVAAGGVAVAFGAVMKGIGSNAQFETYNTQFAVLLKNTDEFKAKTQGITDPLKLQAMAAQDAKDRMADLAAFGASTPFDLPQVVEADKILQGFGLHSSDVKEKFGFSAKEIQTIAGDTASGTGASFQEMATYLGKFSSGATGEVISRFQELGIVTKTQLAEMGLNFDKGGALVINSQEEMDHATGILMTAMKNKYGGMMDQQSATFDGMMSNLGDWVDGTIRMMSAPIFTVVSDQLKGLLAFLGSDAVKGGLNNFATSIAEGIKVGLPVLLDFGSKVMAAIMPLGDFIINNVIPAFSNMGSSVSSVSPFLTIFMAAITGVTGIVTANMPLIQQVITTALGIIGSFWNANGASITQSATEAYNRIMSIISIAMPLISSIITSVLTFINGFMQAHGTQILQIMTNTWNVIKNIVMIALDFIEGILKVALAVYNGDWSGAWVAMQEMCASIVTRIWDIIKSNLDTIAAFFGTSLSAIVTDWTNKFNDLLTSATNTFDQVKTAITDFFNDPGKLIRDGLQRMVDAISGYYDTFKTAGSSLISNLSGGILGAFDSLIEDAKTKLGALRDLLPGSEPRDPSSPLRGLAKRGAALVQNLQDGINSGSLSINPLSDSLDPIGFSASAISSNVSMPNRINTGAGNTFVYQIDARGSAMNEDQFRSIIQEVLNTTAQTVRDFTMIANNI